VVFGNFRIATECTEITEILLFFFPRSLLLL